MKVFLKIKLKYAIFYAEKIQADKFHCHQEGWLKKENNNKN